MAVADCRRSPAVGRARSASSLRHGMAPRKDAGVAAVSGDPPIGGPEPFASRIHRYPKPTRDPRTTVEKRFRCVLETLLPSDRISEMPQVSEQITAVIVTYESAAEIGSCLKALDRWSISAVVVDNASSDATVEVVRASGARLIVNESNRGFAAAVNQGCSACDTELILLLNPDTVLESDPRILAEEFRC